jgi:D-beta-D-heptose 7-phosphate kinase/D-beta-D-heptose 1-phosphate adenosyltransferase
MKALYHDASQLAEYLKESAPGKKVVFTNGCFDIIHPGHIHLLRTASEQGDILLVGLNSDSSVKKIKGPARPVMDHDSRAQILLAFEMVDFVIIFDEETPLQVISALRPDVLVKGSEYGGGEIVGEDLVEQTVRVPMVNGFSSTDIIERSGSR